MENLVDCTSQCVQIYGEAQSRTLTNFMAEKRKSFHLRLTFQGTRNTTAIFMQNAMVLVFR